MLLTPSDRLTQCLSESLRENMVWIPGGTSLMGSGKRHPEEAPSHRVDLANHYNWWGYIPGSDWRHPEGPKSSIADRAHHPAAKACCGGTIPKGDRELSYDPHMPDIRIPRKVIKGGSFLCAQVYCRRCRPAARMAQPVDTSTCHVGIRLIVRSPQSSEGSDGHNTNPVGQPKAVNFK
jgi:formylglycine-generating enzyme required for sulfatase activity